MAVSRKFSARAWTQDQQEAKINELRKRYPFQLVRPHSIDPRPETIKGFHFVRWPTPVFDEWMFETRADRDWFYRRHGGQKVS